jgi:hypothetical protein
MKQYTQGEEGQWKARAAASTVLLFSGAALLGAARNDHWSATVGLALGQVSIAAGAWVIVRPLLSLALVALGGQNWLALLPTLLMTVYTLGVVFLAGGTAMEQAFLAAYLILPGPLLDALLVWYEGQTGQTKPQMTKESFHDHDRP